MSDVIHKTLEFKLYPSATQAKTLDEWLGICCWLYNRALEQRIKAYDRRKQSTTLYDQYKRLTEMRSRMLWLKKVPVAFARSALRRALQRNDDLQRNATVCNETDLLPDRH